MEIDNIVRDKIVFATVDESFKERFLREVGLNLQRAVDLCHSCSAEITPNQSFESAGDVAMSIPFVSAQPWGRIVQNVGLTITLLDVPFEKYCITSTCG